MTDLNFRAKIYAVADLNFRTRAIAQKGGEKVIGGKIKVYLQENGIKQSFVAEKSGLTDSIISDICNEKRKVDVIEYYKICKALQLPLNYFLEGVSA